MMDVVEQQVLLRHIHTESIDTCGAEVQKGNAPTETKDSEIIPSCEK